MQFAIARTYHQNVPPSLNIVSGWHAFETMCECVKENRPFSVRAVVGVEENLFWRCVRGERHFSSGKLEITVD